MEQMRCFVACLAALALLLAGFITAFAKSSSDVLIIVDAAGKAFVVGKGQAGAQVIELPAEVFKFAEQLKAEVGAGLIAQDGPSAPRVW